MKIRPVGAELLHVDRHTYIYIHHTYIYIHTHTYIHTYWHAYIHRHIEGIKGMRKLTAPLVILLTLL